MKLVIDLSRLELTRDMREFRLPIISSGIPALKEPEKVFLEKIGLSRAWGTMYPPIGKPYKQESGYYVNVSVSYRELAEAILMCYGEPSRISFTDC